MIGAAPPSAADASRSAVHATAVVVCEAAVLIRGRSGVGKSRLALALLDLGHARDVHACLVGDDRVLLHALSGRLLVEPHPAILGKIERRGLGILTLPYQAHAVVRLVADFIDANAECDIPPRFPDAGEFRTMIEGVTIPRMTLLAGASAGDAAAEVFNRLRGQWTAAG